MNPRLDHFAAGTEPPPGAVDRLRIRLGTVAHPAVAPLRAEPPALDRAAAASVDPRRPARPRLPLVSALLAAAVLLCLHRVPATTPLDAALTALTPAELALTDAVALRFSGEGRVSGTDRAPHIHWEVGVLDVEVAAGRGVDLRVSTAEAEVEVVGTGFQVRRDVFGTTVGVGHGRVRVICGVGPAAILGAGETRVCLPTSPAGWLARATGLEAAGADPGAVIDAARAGLAAGPDPALRGELLARLVDAHLRAGDAADAAQAAAGYPPDGPRAAAMRALALGSSPPP